MICLPSFPKCPFRLPLNIPLFWTSYTHCWHPICSQYHPSIFWSPCTHCWHPICSQYHPSICSFLHPFAASFPLYSSPPFAAPCIHCCTLSSPCIIPPYLPSAYSSLIKYYCILLFLYPPPYLSSLSPAPLILFFPPSAVSHLLFSTTQCPLPVSSSIFLPCIFTPLYLLYSTVHYIHVSILMYLSPFILLFTFYSPYILPSLFTALYPPT
jgi:hypothetical protein